MTRRNRRLMLIGVILLAGWLAWKVLHTASRVPTPAPVTGGIQR